MLPQPRLEARLRTRATRLSRVPANARPGRAQACSARGLGARKPGARAGRVDRARPGPAQPLPSFTPGSLDWSILTSAMLGRGPSHRPLGAGPELRGSDARRLTGTARGQRGKAQATEAAADSPGHQVGGPEAPPQPPACSAPRPRSIPNIRSPEMDPGSSVRRERGDRKAARRANGRARVGTGGQIAGWEGSGAAGL